MMPKAAASAAVPKEVQWPSVAPRALAVPKEPQWPPLDPEWHRRDQQRVARRQQRRITPLERQDSAPDDERGPLRRFDNNVANHSRRNLGNFPPITVLGPSGSSGSGPIITYDVRRPPSGPSSSSGQIPAPQRLRTRSPVRRSASPDRRRDERNVRRRSETTRFLPWEEPSDSSQGSPVQLEPPVQRPRPNKQVEYAGRILAGTANLGASAEQFMDTIRRDITYFSKQGVNRYLKEFYSSRKAIAYPNMDMSGYPYQTVLDNALLEFSLENWRVIRLTSVYITEFSVAILRLISEADNVGLPNSFGVPRLKVMKIGLRHRREPIRIFSITIGSWCTGFVTRDLNILPITVFNSLRTLAGLAIVVLLIPIFSTRQRFSQS